MPPSPTVQRLLPRAPQQLLPRHLRQPHLLRCAHRDRPTVAASATSAPRTTRPVSDAPTLHTCCLVSASGRALPECPNAVPDGLVGLVPPLRRVLPDRLTVAATAIRAPPTAQSAPSAPTFGILAMASASSRARAGPSRQGKGSFRECVLAPQQGRRETAAMRTVPLETPLHHALSAETRHTCTRAAVSHLAPPDLPRQVPVTTTVAVTVTRPRAQMRTASTARRA